MEDLADQCNCFISTLKTKENIQNTIFNLRTMDLRKYSLDECEYGISYIFDQELKFKDYGEIEKFLKNVDFEIKKQ